MDLEKSVSSEDKTPCAQDLNASTASHPTANDLDTSLISSIMPENEFSAVQDESSFSEPSGFDDQLKNHNSSFDPPPTGPTPGRFPIDGYDTIFRFESSDLRGDRRTTSATSRSSSSRLLHRAMACMLPSTTTINSKSTIKGSSNSRLGLFGARFKRSTSRFSFPQRSQSNKHENRYGSIKHKTVRRHRQADTSSTMVDSANPLRIPPSPQFRSQADTSASCSSGSFEIPQLSYDSSYYPTIAVASIQVHTFSVVNTIPGLKGNSSSWLIVKVTCETHNAGFTPTSSLRVLDDDILLQRLRIRNHSGELRDLILEVSLPENCNVLTSLGHTTRPFMEPRNVWTVGFNLKTGGALTSKLPITFKAKDRERTASSRPKLTSQVLMDELQGMLKMPANKSKINENKQVVNISLSYKHSLFPEEVLCTGVKSYQLNDFCPLSQPREYGRGSLVNMQNRSRCLPNTVEDYNETARSIKSLLHDDLILDDHLPGPGFSTERLNVDDVLKLLADFERVASGNLTPMSKVDLKLMRHAYGLKVKKQRDSSSNISVTPSLHESSQRPPIINLNAPIMEENRRHGLELDRDSEDLTAVLQDLTNTRRGRFTLAPSPLFSPRRRPRKMMEDENDKLGDLKVVGSPWL